MQRVPRIHIVGRKNSGKTTLVCELVQHLTKRGLRVATVKHTHHQHELGTPGKDSHMHRTAGAAGVGILSGNMTAAFVPVDRSVDEHERYARFDVMFQDCDLILVEGDLSTSARRIEVWRSEVTEQPYACRDGGIHMVVSDDKVLSEIASVPRGDIQQLVDEILGLASPRPDVGPNDESS